MAPVKSGDQSKREDVLQGAVRCNLGKSLVL